MDWTKIRYKIIKRLLSDDEKYLLIRAIDERRDSVERRAVLDRTADRFDADADIDNYNEFREVFSVDGMWV